MSVFEKDIKWITWVNEEILISLIGYFVVEYEAVDKNGIQFFTDKLFDMEEDAKHFVKECKKEIEKYDKMIDEAYNKWMD